MTTTPPITDRSRTVLSAALGNPGLDRGDLVTPRHHQPSSALTPGEYVLHRTGTPLGAPGSLRSMLARSLGARSFAAFWQHWNPIWGYALGRFVHTPVRRFAPAWVAVIATFLVSGLLHDAAATIVRRSVTFVVTPWFLLLAIGVLVARATDMDLSRHPWWRRAAVNLSYVVGCLVVALQVTSLLGIGGA